MGGFPRVTEVSRGLGSRVQASALRAGAAVSRRVSQGRGFSRYVELLSRGFSPNNSVTLEVWDRKWLTVPMYDAYWLAPLMTGRDYEPEVAKVLSMVLGKDGGFIDCGANVGYWSVFASRWIEHKERIVAIEPSSLLFDLLRKNSQQNGDAFTCANQAVWSEPNLCLSMAADSRRHSWGSVSPDVRRQLTNVGFAEQEVRSTTIDDYLPSMDNAEPIVVKIDVEGAELEAVQGASQVLARDPLVIYEEHGRDREARVSKALANEHGLELFHCDQKDGELMRVDPNDVHLRPDRARGYNFFACRAGSSVHSIIAGGMHADA